MIVKRVMGLLCLDGIMKQREKRGRIDEFIEQASRQKR